MEGKIYRAKRVKNNWDIMFKAATDYSLKHGNLDVPTSYATVNGLLLGRWIKTMRRAYVVKGIELNDCQIAMLDSIGMDWKVRKVLSWNDYYELAKDYYNAHGNLLIPPSFIAENVNLGRWIERNKKAYRGVGKSPALTEEQIHKLETIGMRWYPLGKNVF